MRLDRFASVYVLHPLVGKRAQARLRIPILMYHGISEKVDHNSAYYQTTTSPLRFREQMDYLRENGYTAIRLSDAITSITEQRSIAAKPVVITFDDGFRDFYQEAFPVLAACGFTASMYLPTGYIGDRTSTFQGNDCMTWKEIRELDNAGIEFGSHTVTHPKLTDLSFEAIEVELRCSRQTIEYKLGHAVTTFAYPFAFPETRSSFVAKLRDTLRNCNYAGGVCTAIGTASAEDDHFFLPRLPVNSADDVALFRAKLEGGYDWLHGLQRLKKTFAGRS